MMNTEVLVIDPDRIDYSKIQKATGIINAGGIVAFPTETVYGLGADALNPHAVAKIFEAKKRPLDDPLIVHIADKEDLHRLTENIPDIALKLIENFWPGPLTLVLEKSDIVPYIVTGGLDTVAIRMPDNPVALALIREAHTPIAAPSANLFGRPSPVTSQHVIDDLNGKIDMVIDGGKVNIGIESTVLDVTQMPPCILRPGGIGLEELRKITPSAEIYRKDNILCPGMYPRHYSPKARVILAENEGEAQLEEVKNLAEGFFSQGYSVGIIAKDENRNSYGDFNIKILGPSDNLNICASNLFSILREFDKEGVDVIVVEGVKEEGLGFAIMDRLRKASGYVK